jgi:hypothetical protein
MMAHRSFSGLLLVEVGKRADEERSLDGIGFLPVEGKALPMVESQEVNHAANMYR